MSPQRIQRTRRAGWRLPPNARYVGRPSKWGNPFVTGMSYNRDDPLFTYLARTVPGGVAGLVALTPLRARDVVDAHPWWLFDQPHLMCALGELTGRDLVCWCALDQPCHADTLLELANEGSAE